MCGFAGIYDSHLNRSGSGLYRTVKNMTGVLRHRGPDDSGVWRDESAGIAFGHQRLAILDLSSNGRQPMHSSDGRYVIVYNGEIYNFKEIRKNFIKNGVRFRGESDTEVMLVAIQHFGVEKALSAFNGMFAFALWDRRERQLFLARDRMGEKPVYYGIMGSCIIFGSELKALVAYEGFQHDIDQNALSLFLKLNYVPTPFSIYKNVRKLPQATFVVIKADDSLEEVERNAVCYWDLKTVINTGQQVKYNGTEEEAENRVHSLMSDAVRLRMVSDVSLGAFLSGGLDSSTIVALMQVHSTSPVKTFTIGFNEMGFNEAEYAKKVASYLGTEHTELYINPKEAMNVIPMLAYMYDEPYADVSGIPTYLVSKLAKQSVTVVLSGDGGDEVFGGYNRYLWGRRIWSSIGWMPFILRILISRSILGIPQTVLYQFEKAVFSFFPVRWRQPRFADQLHKIAYVINARDPYNMYFNMIVNWKDEKGIDEQLSTIQHFNSMGLYGLNGNNFTNWMMYMDSISYLPDDILVKVDRASMAVSLESRAPFLDHGLIELLWRLPLGMKINKGTSKYLLRKILSRYIPKSLIERPKMGFGVPIGKWLVEDLRDWAEDLLSYEKLAKHGLMDIGMIRETWKEHLSGKRRWTYELWTVLMFQAWYYRMQ